MKLNKKGFTLLEIIIVIIIIGVIAALALPRLFSTIEYSRSTEALNSLGVIRGSLERCALANNGVYTNCVFATGNPANNLDVQDPSLSPNAHFAYRLNVGVLGTDYTIFAQRNGLDAGDSTSLVYLYQQRGAGGTIVSRGGTGAFIGLGNPLNQ